MDQQWAAVTSTYQGSKINKYTNSHMTVVTPLLPLHPIWFYIDMHHAYCVGRPSFCNAEWTRTAALGPAVLSAGKAYKAIFWPTPAMALCFFLKTSTHTKTGVVSKMTVWWTVLLLVSNRTWANSPVSWESIQGFILANSCDGSGFYSRLQPTLRLALTVKWLW